MKKVIVFMLALITTTLAIWGYNAPPMSVNHHKDVIGGYDSTNSLYRQFKLSEDTNGILQIITGTPANATYPMQINHPPGVVGGNTGTKELMIQVNTSGEVYVAINGTLEIDATMEATLGDTITVNDNLYVNGDLNVGGVFSAGSTTGVTMNSAEITGNLTTETLVVHSETTLNADGDSDGDFIWQSDNNTRMIHGDASADAVGIGAAANAAYSLEVTGPTHVSGHFFVDGQVTQDAGNVVFNEAAGNYDFRIESTSNENLIFADTSADAVGIGTNTPSYSLEVNGNVGINSTLYLTGDADFNGDLSVADTLEADKISAEATTITVLGNINQTGTYTVSGAITANGGIQATDTTVEIGTNLSVSGQANISTLEVAGVITNTLGIIANGGLSATDDTIELNSNMKSSKKISCNTVEVGDPVTLSAATGSLEVNATINSAVNVRALQGEFGIICDPNDTIINVNDGMAVMGAANLNSDAGDIDTDIQADNGVAIHVDGTGSGKVGILTDNPSVECHVVGSAIVQNGSLEIRTTSASANSPILSLTCDNGGTDQYIQMQGIYGADPYLRYTINGSAALDYHALSLSPAGGDNVFDLGSSGSSYKDGWFDGNLNVGGTVAATIYTGDGSLLTGISDGTDTAGVQTIIDAYSVTSVEVLVLNGNSFGADSTFGLNDAYDLKFEVGGTQRLMIDSAGSVCIGTTVTAPIANLQIANGTGQGASLQLTSTGQGHLATDGLRITSGTSGALFQNFENNNMIFSCGGEDVLAVDDGECVGINTNTPNYQLQVHEDAAGYASNIQLTNASIGNTSGDGTCLQNRTDGAFRILNQEAAGQIAFMTNSVSREVISAAGVVTFSGSSSDTTDVDITGTLEVDGLAVDTNVLVVDGTTNYVGIGTATPSYKVDIKVGSGTQLAIGDTSYNSAVFRADGVYGSILLATSNSGSASGYTERAQLTQSGIYPLVIQTTNTAELVLGTHDTARITIEDSGEVRIAPAGIPVCANEAACAAIGLPANSLYRTGANPDVLCIYTP